MDRVTGQEPWATAPWTAQDTARLRRGSAGYAGRSRTAGAALLLLLAIAALVPVFAGTARAEEDSILSGSGIQYPGGFDMNTVGEIRGRAEGLDRPERGPVRFRLLTGRESYIVLGSPAWFWRDTGADLPEGTEVRVLGSKTLGRDGRLYIIAQEMKILPSGRSVVLRHSDGYPLWKGPREGPFGTRGGFGSPMNGGMGGMGSDHGGMGGRHR